MKVDSYVNMNFNARYDKVLNSSFYIELYVNNLLNSEILFPTDATNKWADKGLPGPQRNFLLTLGYKFYRGKTKNSLVLMDPFLLINNLLLVLFLKSILILQI